MGAGKILLIVGAVMLGLCLVGGIGLAALVGGSKPTTGNVDTGIANPATGAAAAPTNGAVAPTTVAAAKAGHAKIGQPARDGKFEFVVTKVEYGKTTVGDQYLNKTAQGQFVLVTVTVKNIGNEPRTFSGGDQTAVGPGGVKYRDDGEAELYANSHAQTFLNDINPGNSVAGVLVFDIPKDAKLVSLELHDSSFSGGITVDLS